MTQQQLNGAHVGPGFQQMNCKTCRLSRSRDRRHYPGSGLCREFLGQRRGARRLESIRRVAAATVG